MSVKLDSELLAILVCPETKQVLSSGSEEILGKVQDAGSGWGNAVSATMADSGVALVLLKYPVNYFTLSISQ